jgi:catechol 2,3-dioxygenase-like lactoylglutathione lyase family enzyme
MSTTSEFVRAVDFIGMPSKDLDASVAFYGETLGLPRSVYIPDRHYSEFETGNLTLSVYNPEKIGPGAQPRRQCGGPPRRRCGRGPQGA